MTSEQIVERVKEALISAGSTFKEDKKNAYRRAIQNEENEKAKWDLEKILENAEIAEKERIPL